MFFKLFTATSWLLNSFHYIIESFTDFFYTATSLSLDGHHYKQISPSKDHSQIIVTLLVSGNYSFFFPDDNINDNGIASFCLPHLSV